MTVSPFQTSEKSQQETISCRGNRHSFQLFSGHSRGHLVFRTSGIGAGGIWIAVTLTNDVAHLLRRAEMPVRPEVRKRCSSYGLGGGQRQKLTKAGKPLELPPEDRQRLPDQAVGFHSDTLRQISSLDPAELVAPSQEPDLTKFISGFVLS
jgi:hypothetical protein